MAALSQAEDRFKRAEMLIDIGTRALRLKFDELLPPTTLQEKLQELPPTTLQEKLQELPPTTLQEKLQEAKHIINRVASRQQFATLYPKYGTVSSMNMDLTLMVLVLRNTGLPAPQSSTFDNKPFEHEISDGADVARLKFYRNELTHSKVKELNEQQFEEISRTIIKVIKRLSGSRFEDLTELVKTGSLDYRADSISWHAKQTIALLPQTFIKGVLQPATVSVIRLHEHQPLHYSIIGGMVISHGIQTLSEIQLTYYLRVLQSVTVRQCIFVLNEHPFLKAKLAQLILDQETPADIMAFGNTTINTYNSSPPNSTLSSDIPGLFSQCGHVKHGYRLLSRPCVMDNAYTNADLTVAPFYKRQCCKNYTKECFRREDQQHSRSTSQYINDSVSTNSTTKIECSSGSNIEKNVSASNQTELQPKLLSSSKFKRNITDQQMDYMFSTIVAFEMQKHSRDQTNSASNTSRPNPSQFDLNRSTNITIEAPENTGSWTMIIATIILSVLSIIVIYPKLLDYFKSRFIATSLTVLVVFLELSTFYLFYFVYYYYILDSCLGLVFWSVVCAFSFYIILVDSRPRQRDIVCVV